MKILAIYNIKGGVGKTTSAVNLAYLAAREGVRVLVWDLDPQGAASFYFRVKPKIKGGSKALVRGKRAIDDLVKGTDYENLDLLPADFSYRHMDLHFEGARKPTRRIRRLLEPLARRYDIVFLDCPPSISLVSENVFAAADALLVPLIPTTLSLRTLDQLMRFRRKNGLERVAVLPFFSMADRRKTLHRRIMASLPEKDAQVLHAFVPYLSEVEQMGIMRAPLAAFVAPGSPALAAYEALWAEIKARL